MAGKEWQRCVDNLWTCVMILHNLEVHENVNQAHLNLKYNENISFISKYTLNHQIVKKGYNGKL